MVRLAAIQLLECQTQHSLPVRALGIARFQYGAAMMSWLLKPWVSGSTAKAVGPPAGRLDLEFEALRVGTGSSKVQRPADERAGG